ncbi:hypothetical protein [Curtobacterium sp. MCBD17_028]|uniref:terminase small subunit n=1 Tax=Curtobacterium sp. MCBD17_028 TaxID=2175670 RepID=UPI000DA8ADA0|nr:hypothetical protein [Curtobacterium sp. MCBD17_028]PZE23865.1 hypothetical protein DEI86_13560 [Curtobacterium sp. MCBD17_028]
MSLAEQFEASVEAAQHLDERDHAAVELGRMMARKIDAWMVIVGWAEADAEERGGRPLVPQNDNVTMSAFLKTCDALGLTPMSRRAIDAASRPRMTGGGDSGDDDEDDKPREPARVTSAAEYRSRAGRRSS